MCFLRHNWSKWESYKVQVKRWGFFQSESDVSYGTEIRQKRTCNSCGKMQDVGVR